MCCCNPSHLLYLFFVLCMFRRCLDKSRLTLFSAMRVFIHELLYVL